jgi:hypothetical protein
MAHLPRLLAGSVLLASTSLTSPTFAQSVNVDFNRTTGAGAGAPASTYTAASGQGGVWNAVTPTSAAGGQLVSLTAASGVGSVVMKHKATNGPDSASYGNGEFSKLMADYAIGLTQNGAVEVTFYGLEAGVYDIFVYTGLPESEAFYTQFGQTIPHKAFVGLYENDTSYLGGATTAGFVAAPTFQQGVNYARFTAAVADESSLTITVNADLAYSLAKVGVNGMQLRKWDHARLHVTPIGAGDKSGRNWANAMAGLQSALVAAENLGEPLSEIWMAGGTYKPSLNNRAASFELVDGVALRGGFSGNEETLEERAGNVETILSGNIGLFSTNADNSYTVVRATNVYAGLDRLTIRDGRANGSLADWNGYAGGVFASASYLWLTDCVIADNHGNVAGGMYHFWTHAKIDRCELAGNVGVDGGAIHHHEPEFGGAGAWLEIRDSSFQDNSASGDGGAIHWRSDEDTWPWNTLRCRVERSTFLGNVAAGDGGAFHGVGERAAFWSSLFNGNEAYEGGAISFEGLEAGVVACTVTSNHANYRTGGIAMNIDAATGDELYVGGSVLWGNTATYFGNAEFKQLRNSNGLDPAAQIAVSHSCIAGNVGSFAQEASMSSDPAFIDLDGADNVAGTDDDDLHLLASSPCIDAGVNYNPNPTSDLDGLPRQVDDSATVNAGTDITGWTLISFVDMGCFERQAGDVDPPCNGDLNDDAVVDGADLAILLGSWGSDGSGDLNLDGVVDGADLGALLGAWGSC